MNTIHDSHEPSYPTLQEAWHKMIRRSRATDRAIALILCRAAFREGNGGRFKDFHLLSDDELCEKFGFTPRQVIRLRQGSPLWCRVGNDLSLFFYGQPVLEGHPDPASFGKRRARHAKRKRERAQREQGRLRLGSLPYTIPDGDAWLAADGDETL